MDLLHEAKEIPSELAAWLSGIAEEDTDLRGTEQRFLEAVARHHGSIGTPVAGQLGVTRAELRRLIEQWELAQDVYRLRKYYRRSPARLRDEDHIPFCYRVYEKRLPPPLLTGTQCSVMVSTSNP